MNIIQIGANRGNDDLSEIIGGNQPNNLILVEPMSLHNEFLLNHYNWVNNLSVENLVIDVESNKDVEFFYHLDDGPNYEVASLSKEHIYVRHTQLSPDRITSLMLKTITINDLFIKHNLTDIDILFIDAEGHDDTIIRSIDFNQFNVNKIYFENLHLKDESIFEFLINLGYQITEKTGTYGWCSLAEKTPQKKINKIIFDSLNSTTNLCELGLKFHTDKSPISKYELRHSYTILYDFIFGKLKYEKIKIAEIGIWKNASLKCFREYFPNAEIYGFEKHIELIEDAKNDNLEKTHYYSLDGAIPETIYNSFQEAGGNFDVIIDDGSHLFEHQINVILNTIPFLKPGGILIIEDIFKSINENDFEEKLSSVKKYFHSISFVETKHQLQYTGSWDNDKLLVLYRNNILI
jgi:FkbM family methyltransferase